MRDTQAGGNVSQTLRLSLRAGRRLQSTLTPYTADDVVHIVFSLHVWNGAGFEVARDAVGDPIAFDLARDAALAAPITLAGLQRATRYGVFAEAYRSAGSAPADRIDRDDGALADWTLGGDDTPAPLTMTMTLADRPVTVALAAPAAPLASPSSQAPQRDVAVAYSPTSDVQLIAWQVQGESSQIFIQRLAADGAPLAVPVALASPEIGTGHPAVAFDSTRDRFLVAWEGPTDIVACTVTADGTTVSAPLAVAGQADNSTLRRPTVAYGKAEDTFLLAWEDDDGADTYDVRAQCLSAATLAAAGSVLVGLAAAGETSPAVSWLAAAGQFLVAWTGQVDGSVQLQRLEVDGGTGGAVRTGPEATLAATAGQTRPALAYDTDSDALMVAWEDARHAVGKPARGTDIYVQRFDAALEPVGAQASLLGETGDVTGDQRGPALAFNGQAGEWVCAFTDATGNTGVQRLSRAGARIGGRIAIADGGDGGRAGAAIAYADRPDQNSLLVLWDAPDGGTTNIWLRQLDSRLAP
jgi:hypothetical protein